LKYLKITGLFALLAIVGLAGVERSYAQTDERIITFSGVVTDENQTTVLSGVSVYVKSTGRGTSTSLFGVFELPVRVGDSIVFSSVGFKRQYIQIPDNVEGDKLRARILMPIDTLMLDPLTISLFPEEDAFKDLVLSMDLPEANRRAQEALDQELMYSMLQNMPVGAEVNYRYYESMRTRYLQDGFGPRPNPLLNPFAWSQLINSFKRNKRNR